MEDQEWHEFEKAVGSYRHELMVWKNGVEEYLAQHPKLRDEDCPIVHSTKSRLKSSSHIRGKIDRKRLAGRDISVDNVLSELSDLAGVRILLLFQEDFGVVHDVINSRVDDGFWFLREPPKAYTWDPENAVFFESFGLEVAERDTLYTSVHYLIMPKEESPICCELQVRTLFEEIWGEVDHRLNYPNPTTMVACREQLKVLSKIVGAGSRLVDSIARTINDKSEAQREP